MLLIVDNKTKRGQSYADLFYWMDVLAIHQKPIPALSELSPAVGAVLIVEPERSSDAEEYVTRMRSLCQTTPILALTDATLPYAAIFDGVLSMHGFTSVYLGIMREAGAVRGQRCVGTYRLMGMDLSCTSEQLTYRGAAVPLTKTERMILRYLFLVHPRRVSAHEILSHAYRTDKRPEPPTVRAHVCAINKKLLPLLGRPLIDCERGYGYLVTTPEAIAMRQQAVLSIK